MPNGALSVYFWRMMNKYALAFAAIALANSTSAQWITLTDEYGNDVTNSSIDHWEVNSSNPFTMVIHLEAELNGGGNRTVNVKRYEMGVTAGTQNYFCWNLCYLPRNAGQTPLWIGGDSQAMVPGVPFTGFGGYHIPNGDFSLSCYRYVWYDVANPNDSAFVDLCFESAVGIGEALSVDQFSIVPNPANAAAMVNFSLANGNADGIVVHNALGGQVMKSSVAAAQRSAQLSTASLPEGVYFVSLMDQGRTLRTQRLVVSR